jgi:hypothetical protein
LHYGRFNFWHQQLAIAMVQEDVVFYGHPNVRSTHNRTFEITKSSNLTLRGDCIIGVRADKACSDLDQTLKRLLKEDNSIVSMQIMVGNKLFQIKGQSNNGLLLLNKHDIVVRKTSFICHRTMSIGCDKASSDIPRDTIQLLQDPETKGILRIIIE